MGQLSEALGMVEGGGDVWHGWKRIVCLNENPSTTPLFVGGGEAKKPQMYGMVMMLKQISFIMVYCFGGW